MAKGARALAARLAGSGEGVLPLARPPACLLEVGRTLGAHCGGTSGAIYKASKGGKGVGKDGRRRRAETKGKNLEAQPVLPLIRRFC